MSGLCGMFNQSTETKMEKPVLSKMLSAIAHRGADGKTEYVENEIAVGYVFTKQADFDYGQKPIESEDGRYSMLCSGTIYNAESLRVELEAKGHRFQTNCPAEVLLHLFEEEGEKTFPVRVNGQFTVALYDKKEKVLYLLRDHLGVSPLFYTFAEGRVIFGSEIKAILEHPGVERRLNLQAVDQLMNFPGLAAPTTFFKNIYSLEPGHILKVQMGKEPEKTEYWDVCYQPEEGEDKGLAYYAEAMREQVKTAIERRITKDVPSGFYISGGLDSSAVACFVHEYGLKSTDSFSAKIGSGDLDESAFQKIVLDMVQSNHHLTRVGAEEILENLPQVVYTAESGIKETYDTAAFLLSKLVQDETNIHTVLTGQGSDEFLYGYVGYMLDQFRGMQKAGMSEEERQVNERLWGDPFFRYERIHPEIRKVHQKVYSEAAFADLDHFSAIATSPIHLDRVQNLSTMKRRSYIDSKLRLGEHLLGEHGDRMFAAHGVEGRHPFLDVELLNFVMRLPDKYKLNGTNEKYILKKACEGIVPKEILNRKKFPFQAPGMSTLVKLGKEMPFLSEDLIRKYNIFDADYVKEMQKAYAAKDFKLMGAYEIDYLLIVMTVTMLCEAYGLSV